MNKIFVSIISIFALLLVFQSINIPVYDKKIYIPYWTVYPLSLIVLLFLFWKMQEIKETKLHEMILKFRSYIRAYLEKKNAIKSDNLLLEFPEQIRGNKDLYYINNSLVIMTNNHTMNNEFKPGGYYLKMNRYRYYWLYLVTGLKVIFDYKYVSDCFLLAVSILLLMLLIYKTLILASLHQNYTHS